MAKKGFYKGVSGNPNGRPKGAENKVTTEARELFVAILEKQVDNIEYAFDAVLNGTDTTRPDPAKYLELYAKYAQYFVPKKVDLTSGNKEIQAPVIQVLPPSDK